MPPASLTPLTTVCATAISNSRVKAASRAGRLRPMGVWRGALLPLIFLFASAAPSRPEAVALTFDDLPTLSLANDVGYSEETTQRLLRGLQRHRIPATGFVNEEKLEGADRTRRVALLEEWLDAGMELGNHSYSHPSLTKTPLGVYIADVARGETVTRGLLAKRGRTLRWFRHPYLETGPSLPVREGFERWLAEHQYRVAPVSMENADWMFAYPYDEAVLRGDAGAAARIKGEYVAYTIAVVAWYRSAALQLLGRRPAFVFLLHACRLNADSVNALADILESEGLAPVSLDAAMADPAYQIPDGYVGPDGEEWLSRWSLTLKKELPWTRFPRPPADMVAAEERLDVAP